MVNLVTHGFSTELDQTFRKDLVENFEKIQASINELPDYSRPVNSNNQAIIKLNSNLKSLVEILKMYDVPIGFNNNGDVVDLSQEVK